MITMGWVPMMAALVALDPMSVPLMCAACAIALIQKEVPR